MGKRLPVWGQQALRDAGCHGQRVVGWGMPLSAQLLWGKVAMLRGSGLWFLE